MESGSFSCKEDNLNTNGPLVPPKETRSKQNVTVDCGVMERDDKWTCTAGISQLCPLRTSNGGQKARGRWGTAEQ